MFGFLKTIKFWVIIGLITALGAGVFFAYNEYTGLKNTVLEQQSQIATLTVNNTTLKETLAQSNKAIDDLQNFYDAQQKRINETNSRIQSFEKDVNDLRVLFQSHDLTNLAHAKPELIERRINEATREIFDIIQRDTTR